MLGLKKCLLNVLIYFLIYLTSHPLTIFEIGGEVFPGEKEAAWSTDTET